MPLAPPVTIAIRPASGLLTPRPPSGREDVARGAMTTRREPLRGCRYACPLMQRWKHVLREHPHVGLGDADRHAAVAEAKDKLPGARHLLDMLQFVDHLLRRP